MERGVLIVDPVKYEELRQQFVLAGPSALQVISDFDRWVYLSFFVAILSV